MERLQQRLDKARQRAFVGRRAELARLLALLDGPGRARVAYVHGPGGIGKTLLLQEFAQRVRERGTLCAWIDGEEIGAAFACEFTRAVAELGGSGAIVIDSFDCLPDDETRFRHELLPSLPDGVAVVFAGTRELDLAWRSDPGWHEVLIDLRLGSLSASESRELLRHRGCTGATSELCLRAAGYPLLLSVIADRGGTMVDRGTSAGLLEDLLLHTIGAPPSPAHRDALYAAAAVRRLSEPMLAAILKRSDSFEMFRWLSHRPFVHSRREGLMLHDGLRPVLREHLARRDPALLHRLVTRAGTAILEQLASHDESRDSLIDDAVFLMSCEGGWLGDAPGDDTVRVRSFHPDDWPLIEALVERHEGPTSVQILRRWKDCATVTVYSIDDPESDEVDGVDVTVRLDTAPAALTDADPAARAAKAYLTSRYPRLGGKSVLTRHWLTRERYQHPCPLQGLLFRGLIRRLSMDPDVRFHAQVMRRPVPWAGDVTQHGPRLEPELGFELDDIQYGMLALASPDRPLHEKYGHMFEAWLGRRQARERADLAVNRTLFASQLGQALKVLDRPQLLALNPLASSPLVCGSVDDDPLARARALSEQVRTTASALFVSPKDAHLYRVLELTYFDPLPKQRAAAAEMGVSFSTYRRYLTAGRQRLCDALLAQLANDRPRA